MRKKQSPVGGRATKGAPSVFGSKIIWGEIIRIRVLGAMKKKKAKGKTAAKKTAKNSEEETEKKELNPAQVLKDISALVEAKAKELTVAVIGEGKKGQLSPVKFLFEMAHIFPQPTDESQTSKDEDSLAETLLDRLNIPKRPLVHDELQKEEDEEVMVMQPKKEAAENGESEESSEDDEENVEKAKVTVQ